VPLAPWALKLKVLSVELKKSAVMVELDSIEKTYSPLKVMLFIVALLVDPRCVEFPSHSAFIVK